MNTKMKIIFIDALGLLGIGSIIGGVFLEYGLSYALMIGGASILCFSLLIARNIRRS